MRNKMKKLQVVVLVCMANILFSHIVVAGWGSAQGKIISISTYPDRPITLLRLEGDPGQNPNCPNRAWFALDTRIHPIDQMDRVLSFALTHYALGKDIRISYEDTGGCIEWNSDKYLRIYRVQTP